LKILSMDTCACLQQKSLEELTMSLILQLIYKKRRALHLQCFSVCFIEMLWGEYCYDKKI